jgi:hypothetical protein
MQAPNGCQQAESVGERLGVVRERPFSGTRQAVSNPSWTRAATAAEPFGLFARP